VLLFVRLSLVVLFVSGASACSNASAKVDREALRSELVGRLSASGGARNDAEANCLADAASGLSDADFARMARGQTVSTKSSKRYATAAALCNSAA
jgi:hypothetical protein